MHFYTSCEKGSKIFMNYLFTWQVSLIQFAYKKRLFVNTLQDLIYSFIDCLRYIFGLKNVPVIIVNDN